MKILAGVLLLLTLVALGAQAQPRYEGVCKRPNYLVAVVCDSDKCSYFGNLAMDVYCLERGDASMIKLLKGKPGLLYRIRFKTKWAWYDTRNWLQRAFTGSSGERQKIVLPEPEPEPEPVEEEQELSEITVLR